jgi:hypothetical protein
MSDLIKKPIIVKIRGERTFELRFTGDEVAYIFKDYFVKHYHSAETEGMTLDFAWENDGGITVTGHADIKE